MAREETRKINEKRIQDLRDQNKRKQEELLRTRQEKAERKAKQRTLENRWEMMRWITAYIDNNTERWDVERKERQEKENQWTKNGMDKEIVLLKKSSPKMYKQE